MVRREIDERVGRILAEIHAIANVRCEDGPVIVSCKEASRLLGVSPKTVSMMLRDGRLNKTTIDGSTGILLSAIRKIKTQ